MSSKTLNQALEECLKDKHKISVYEAKVIREMILADGVMSAAERTLLEDALHKDEFDEQAREILSQLLLRAK